MAIKTYKGMDKNMKCHGGFQYEIGKTYEDDGAIRCGEKGFHSCRAPLDVFRYFAPGASRFFQCEADGDIDDGVDDTKLSSSKLTIKTEINIPALVNAQIEYVKEHVFGKLGSEKTAGNSGAATAGEYGAATAGKYGAATAGYSGAATAGEYGAATAGKYGAATAGNSGAATAGKYGAATAGEYGAATAGYSGAATAGYSGAATAGEYGAATAGYGGAATAGEYGAATSRGSVSVGENGAGLVRGNGVKIRGSIGAVLTIVEENDNDYDIACWKSFVVDGEEIKADTWYCLRDGELVECDKHD